MKLYCLVVTCHIFLHISYKVFVYKVGLHNFIYPLKYKLFSITYKISAEDKSIFFVLWDKKIFFIDENLQKVFDANYF